ncbi:hypothetical protein Leryth_018540 [Lithospermum erythrorhizon]|nr:hypothetical protein Leryth_018540 [Lithospermum erythrorhizon]
MIMQQKVAEKKERHSTAMQRTSEWIFSQEISSDVTVIAGGTSFSLHKFPLVSKCGRLRKLVSESTEADVCVIELPEIPGGDEGFELAAKFCYGINFEIGMENIAMLRCAAEFLEMTEDYAIGNLVGRTESYLNEVALKNLTGAVSILHSAESFFQIAEKVKLVSRCIDMIAYIACKDSQFSSSSGMAESGGDSLNTPVVLHQKPIVDWWAEDLVMLRIDLFQRVLIAMISRGFKQCTLAPLLMLYAQKSLRGLETFGKGRKKMEPKDEHEKRVILESIVSLLPREKNAMSVSFLSMLLRAAIYLETTVACRLDLEKRMALQLGQAALDDLLIPSYSFNGDTLFDVETVQRIMTNYLQYDLEGKSFSFNPDAEFESSLPSEMERVGKLMESYLAEIASDRNLSVSKFISLAELIPEQARITEDGMYRAIDIYLKAHPALSDTERKKVCSVMDCQKLSREACAHAAQNDRLPVQTVVQVLYYEQQRLRDVMDGGRPIGSSDSPALRSIPNQLPIIDIRPPVSDEVESLKRENQDLKLELLKTKMKLKEMEKSADRSAMSSPSGSITPKQSAGKPPLPRKSLLSSVSKTFVKLIRAEGSLNSRTRNKPSKNRRHSIS